MLKLYHMANVQNIGLMMSGNEIDVIEEVMDVHCKYFDKILVIDGSDDGTEKIIRSYDCVKYFIKDKEILDKVPSGRPCDPIRQFILEKAQERYPIEGWFTILHGDEIWHNDPNWVAEEAEKARADKVNWYVMNFFLHTSDKERDLESIKSVQERLVWYCPGYLEIRSFRNKKEIRYNMTRYHQTFPEGIGWRIWKHFPIYKHYPYRSVEQTFKKKLKNPDDFFTSSYNNIDLKDRESCFVDILPNYKVARKFDGSFHEFEVKNQGSLLSRWLRAHRYITW